MVSAEKIFESDPNMSDSDSEFEIDFITTAASKTQKNLKLALDKAKTEIVLVNSDEGGNEEEAKSSTSDQLGMSPIYSPGLIGPTFNSCGSVNWIIHIQYSILCLQLAMLSMYLMTLSP